MKILLRRILNSAGKYAVEAEVHFEDGRWGRASSPSAICPGKREIPTTNSELIKKRALIEIISKREIGEQQEWDEFLFQHKKNLGSDVLLSLSLAFARANAARMGKSLVSYIQDEANLDKQKVVCTPLAAVFSGGVHNINICDGMQQIMIMIKANSVLEMIEGILKLYGNIEEDIQNKGLLNGYSSSSGMLVDGLTCQEKLEYLCEMISKQGLENKAFIAIDVAAEHLKKERGYLFEGQIIESDRFREILENYIKHYPIIFMEDPFDSNDIQQWKKIQQNIQENVKIYGDDLSATQKQYLDNQIASGEVVKMNQVGTLSKTLETVKCLKKLGMEICVSHRSYETEDTFLCDLAVAIGAQYIKIGGPRRGDRIAKYNQLYRLYETRRN